MSERAPGAVDPKTEARLMAQVRGDAARAARQLVMHPVGYTGLNRMRAEGWMGGREDRENLRSGRYRLVCVEEAMIDWRVEQAFQAMSPDDRQRVLNDAAAMAWEEAVERYAGKGMWH